MLTCRRHQNLSKPETRYFDHRAKESEEFAIEYPQLVGLAPSICVAYNTHDFRKFKKRDVSPQEAYKHVRDCARCQEYVDTSRSILNLYRKDSDIRDIMPKSKNDGPRIKLLAI